MFIKSAKQLITKYYILNKENKQMQNDLDHSHKENEHIQNDLDYLHEENEHMQNSINQIISLTKQLNDLNNKLGSQITCEQKSRANLNTKQLKEIESLKSEINLKDFEIISFEARINELEAELEQIAQKALLKNTDTTLSLYEIKVKKLKNELEQVMQNLSFRDGLIFCLQSRVSDLKDELEQISLKPDSSSNDLKTGGDAVEEISGFSKTPSFSSHHSEPEPDKSKVKDV
ncbi:9687_t:CDS:1, partial [Racocetra persica]